MNDRAWIRIYWAKPTDARGWIALGCYSLVLAVLGMILVDQSLLESDAFLILATAIVITGWVNGPVGWAYQATKGGGEMAESSARIAEKAAGLSDTPPPANVEAAAQIRGSG
jgi:hypothetical protein